MTAVTAVTAPGPSRSGPSRRGPRATVARGAAGAVLVLLVVAPLLLLAGPALLGGRALTVRSGSMGAQLPTGSLAVIRPVAAADLHVGDVVTVRQARGGLVTHRIVAVDRNPSPALLTLRGDANRVADPEPVPVTAVLGRLWFDVPAAGRLRDRIAAARPGLVWTGVGLLAACSAAQFGAVALERRRQR